MTARQTATGGGRPVDVFHIGPQKSGTTWVWRCLREHPRIAAPERDSIHFFDMFYAQGWDWYEQFFAGAGDDRLRFDPTPSYIRAPLAAERIAAHCPRAKVMLCLRDPVERAFSHYWHEKKKRRFDFEFAEVLDNYDLFASWIEPGFYATHIERWLRCFPREQMLFLRFEELATDPDRFLRRILEFVGVDAGVRPSVLHKKINAAGPRHSVVDRLLHRADRLLERVGVQGTAAAVISGKREYERGVDPALHAQLLEVCEPEIVRLEGLLDLDLRSWRRLEDP